MRPNQKQIESVEFDSSSDKSIIYRISEINQESGDRLKEKENLDIKEKRRLYMQEYKKREGVREKCNEASRLYYYRKIKNDPQFLEKKRERRRLSYNRKIKNDPELLKKKKEYRNRAEVKEKIKKANRLHYEKKIKNNPEALKKKREYNKQYQSRKEVKEKTKERTRLYRQRLNDKFNYLEIEKSREKELQKVNEEKYHEHEKGPIEAKNWKKELTRRYYIENKINK